MEEIFKEILTSRVYEVAVRTPLDFAPGLSRELGNTVRLKREDLQPVFSFKIRGAYNRISRLSEEEKHRGIICASAGNHAQGVALSAKQLGIDALIVMPATTPRIKVQAVERYGVQVHLTGDSYQDAALWCEGEVARSGRVFIHPFDDPLVIAGQGTVGHEILDQDPGVEYIFVPVGGGGLIAGIALFLKSLRPSVRIIGVEPVDSDAMVRSVQLGEIVTLENVGIFADGVAVKRVGSLTYDLTKRYVDDFITVTTDEICSAIKSIYGETRSIVEPAGALGVAGLRKYVMEKGIAGKRMVAVNSGANMNFDRLQFVAERTRTGEGREALFAVTIPERPGSLRHICETFIADRAITEFNYRLMGRGDAHIFVGISINSRSERDEFRSELEGAGFACIDLTDDELAKTHIRHMVGGRSGHTSHEVLYRFQFPERPGALSHFLSAMSGEWNISLFHYRSHGSDFGRVLIGLEIPPQEVDQFRRFLQEINYFHVDETENPAYRLFL